MAISLTINDHTFHVGDTVRVHYRIIEKEVVSGKTKKEKHEEQKERIQIFEGICIAIRGAGDNRSFTVRRLGNDGVGIERIFPVISPWIKKVTVKKKGDTRRAKLYYLRTKTGKQVGRLGTFVEEPVEVKEKVETKSETPEPAAPATADAQVVTPEPVTEITEPKSADQEKPISDEQAK